MDSKSLCGRTKSPKSLQLVVSTSPQTQTPDERRGVYNGLLASFTITQKDRDKFLLLWDYTAICTEPVRQPHLIHTLLFSLYVSITIFPSLAYRFTCFSLLQCSSCRLRLVFLSSFTLSSGVHFLWSVALSHLPLPASPPVSPLYSYILVSHWHDEKHV